MTGKDKTLIIHELSQIKADIKTAYKYHLTDDEVVNMDSYKRIENIIKFLQSDDIKEFSRPIGVLYSLSDLTIGFLSNYDR